MFKFRLLLQLSNLKQTLKNSKTQMYSLISLSSFCMEFNITTQNHKILGYNHQHLTFLPMSQKNHTFECSLNLLDFTIQPESLAFVLVAS